MLSRNVAVYVAVKRRVVTVRERANKHLYFQAAVNLWRLYISRRGNR
jgi:hypothetical protein